MDQFKKYLTQFRCEKGQAYTHTSIFDPTGSFHIPNEKLNEFYEVYKKALIGGRKLFLTEKPENPSPMRVDLDFRFKLNDEVKDNEVLQRLYNDNFIEKVLIKYYTYLIDHLDNTELSNIDKKVYVLEKPGPVEYKGKIKDGIHIIWPNIVIKHGLQHLIRNRILECAPELFQALPLINPYDDVVDQAIIDRNNWQMYGSRKPESEAYAITKVYDFDVINKKIIKCDLPSVEEEINMVKLLSMRNKVSQEIPYKTDKIEEIEQYIRHLLPVDENKKSKLHNKIFGKSVNISKIFSSEEDLKLAKDLVLKCLNPKRAENYDEWIHVGWALRNIDYNLLSTWGAFSNVSSKYVEGECQALWDKMRIDTMGMGTLKHWAKKDNMAQYEMIINESIIELIDRCTSGAHYDIAVVIHALYKDLFRASSKENWYMFSKEKHRWERSREGFKLRNILSNEVCVRFMKRSAYWSNESGKGDNTVYRDMCHERSKKLNEVSSKLKNSGFKDSIMKECRSLFSDDKFEGLLDNHSHLIGFENGVYDLHLHDFREGLPEDYISYTTGRYYINYDANSNETREIDSYLSQVLTNPEVKEYVLKIFASSLDGTIKNEKFYIFTGTGGNGKSLLLALLQKSIGEYYSTLPISLLTQKRAASNSACPELERTKGRRFAIMQEPGDNEKINIGLMKELSGGDPIFARGLYKEGGEFKPQFKMIMACNDLPNVPSNDGGTWRRIRVVPFDSKFTENPDKNNKKEFNIDADIMDKIERWTETFISMLIHIHKTTDLKVIKEPSDINIATQKYKENNDIIGQYLAEKIVVDTKCKKKMLLNTLSSDFKTWAFNQLKGSNKITPDRLQVKAYVENIYGPYNGGWYGFKFKSDIDTEDSDVE